MNAFDPEAEIRRHFTGPKLDEKLAELKANNPKQREINLQPLRVAIIEAIKCHVATQRASGTELQPVDITMALMDVVCSHIVSTRERSLPMMVIMQHMATTFVGFLQKWFVIVTKEESKHQPGG